MSRIGRMPITVPAGVTVNVAEGNVVTVKGPKGELTQSLRPEMIIKQEGTTITVERPSDDKLHRSVHGLTRTLLHNMVIGVTEGYKKTLDVNGVGYRVAMEGGKLVMNTQEIEPMPVITGAAQYPANIVDTLKSLGEDVIAVDALSLAEQAGTSRAVNVVLMGVISHILDFGDKVWNDALEQCVPAKVLEVNKKAFGLGRNA